MKIPFVVLIFLGFHATAFCQTQATPTAQDLEEQGQALYRAGQYPKALIYFNFAVQADPNSWQAYQQLGNTYYQLGDASDAMIAYQQSLKLNPNNPTLTNFVNNLRGANPAAGTSAAAPDNSQAAPAQQQAPDENPQPLPVSNPAAPGDGLASMNHSRFWTKFGLGYANEPLGDLAASANTFNNGQFNPGQAIFGSVSYTGSASANQGAFALDIEAGLQLNPYMGLGAGFQMILGNSYTANITYDTGDSENLTLNATLVPFTLDYFLFLPESFGRTYAIKFPGILSFKYSRLESRETETNVIGAPAAALAAKERPHFFLDFLQKVLPVAFGDSLQVALAEGLEPSLDILG